MNKIISYNKNFFLSFTFIFLIFVMSIFSVSLVYSKDISGQSINDVISVELKHMGLFDGIFSSIRDAFRKITRESPPPTEPMPIPTSPSLVYPAARISPVSLSKDEFISILSENGPNTPYHTASQVLSSGVSADVLKIIQTTNTEYPYIGLFHNYIGNGLFEVNLAHSPDLKTWTTLSQIETAAGMPDTVIMPDNSVIYAHERNPSGNRPYIEVRYYQTLSGFLSNPKSPTKSINLPFTADASADGTPQFARIGYNGNISNSVIEISYHYFEGSIKDQQGFGTLTNFNSWSGSPDAQLNTAMANLGYNHVGDREWFKIDSNVYELFEARPSISSGWDSWRIFLLDKNTNQITPLSPNISGGAYSLGNPSGSFIKLPDGKSALVFGYFLFSEGAQNTLPGQHVYVYPLVANETSPTEPIPQPPQNETPTEPAPTPEPPPSTQTGLPSCIITTDKQTYIVGEKVILTWTSQNAVDISWVRNSATTVLKLYAFEDLELSGSKEGIARIARTISPTLKVEGSGGQTSTCSTTITINKN